MKTGNMEQSKIDKYLEDPTYCPYCNTGQVEMYDIEYNHKVPEVLVYQNCMNQDCNKCYKEVYTLTSIKEIHEEE